MNDFELLLSGVRVRVGWVKPKWGWVGGGGGGGGGCTPTSMLQLWQLKRPALNYCTRIHYYSGCSLVKVLLLLLLNCLEHWIKDIWHFRCIYFTVLHALQLYHHAYQMPQFLQTKTVVTTQLGWGGGGGGGGEGRRGRVNGEDEGKGED